jgi:type IV secretory pathway VirB2 component (pilin)
MFKLPSLMQHTIFNRVFAKLAAFTAVLTLIFAQAVQAQASGLIPCDGPDCTLNSVVQLMNNLMSIFFKTILPVLFVVMILYLGYSYLTAGGNPAQHAKLLSMAKHMILGLLLILCAFLIVKSILSILGYTDTLGFFS